MSNQLLKFEEREKVAIITLNRPQKHNALSSALREEIIFCLQELEKRETVKVVILTGAGPSFCAGFDLKEFSGGNIDEILAKAKIYHHRVYNFTKPIIAAVNGSALAGGMDLAAMCDIRLASKEASFGQPQVQMGIPAAYELIRTIIPEAAARELCLTGRRINAEEAKNLGFVWKIVPGEELMEEAIRLGELISGNTAGQATKGQILNTQPKLFE